MSYFMIYFVNLSHFHHCIYICMYVLYTHTHHSNKLHSIDVHKKLLLSMAQNTSGLFYCGKHTMDLAQSHSINESPGNPEFSGASEVHGWALLSLYLVEWASRRHSENESCSLQSALHMTTTHNIFILRTSFTIVSLQ